MESDSDVSSTHMSRFCCELTTGQGKQKGVGFDRVNRDN